MLIVNKQRLIPSEVNVVVLKKDDNYFYTHINLYSQATIIEDRYGENLEALKKAISSEEANSDRVEFFLANVPKPLNILGYFLYLVKDLDKIEMSVETLCGCIHVLSRTIDMRNFLKVPKEIRASVEFSLSISEEYEQSWEIFFNESLEYENYKISTTDREVKHVEYSTEDISDTEEKEMSLEEEYLRLLDEDFEIELDYNSDTTSEKVEEEEAIVTDEEEPKRLGGLSMLMGR